MLSDVRNIIGSKEILISSYVPMNHMKTINVKKSVKQVDSMVDYLLLKLGSENHIPFYRKASWKLPDDVLRRLVAVSIEKSTYNPRGYFVACVKRENEYYNN